MPKKSKPFINLEYLEESSGGDFPHYESLAKDLYEKIWKIDKPQIFAVVGEAWVWKSTLINKVEKLSKWEKWIQFDAWRYPERKELWEGFIIELYKQLTWCEYEEIIRKLEWEDSTYIKWFKWMLLVLAVSSCLVSIYYVFICWYDYFWTTVWAVIFLLIEKVFEKATDVAPKDLALTRVIQLEELAINMLKKSQKKRIYVVLEDVDRAWDEGLNFLETLSYFLKHKLPKTSVAIVPIVLVSQQDWNSNMNAYLKCVDHYFIFPNSILLGWIGGFMEGTFSSTEVVFLNILRAELKKILSRSWWLNFRLIKFILRKIAGELVILSTTHKNINPELFVALHFWNIVKKISQNISWQREPFQDIFAPNIENPAYIGDHPKELWALIPSIVTNGVNHFEFSDRNNEIRYENKVVYLPGYYRL